MIRDVPHNSNYSAPLLEWLAEVVDMACNSRRNTRVSAFLLNVTRF